MPGRLAQITIQPDDAPDTQPHTEAIDSAAEAALVRLLLAREESSVALLCSAWSDRSALGLASVLRFQSVLGELNNLLLPPLFTLIAVEIASGGLPSVMTAQVAMVNYLFCSMFLLEWALGLLLARNKIAYLTNLWLLGDFVSSLPLAYIFQGARLVRLGRLLRFVKLLKLIRARRFRFPVQRLSRAVGVALSVAIAGAFALEAVEHDTVQGFDDALWWSLVTITTVGYGDIIPLSIAGRFVAVVLMVTGVGVFSYLAGLMATVVFDPEEDFMMESIVRVEAKLDQVLDQLSSQGSSEK